MHSGSFPESVREASPKPGALDLRVPLLSFLAEKRLLRFGDFSGTAVDGERRFLFELTDDKEEDEDCTAKFSFEDDGEEVDAFLAAALCDRAVSEDLGGMLSSDVKVRG